MLVEVHLADWRGVGNLRFARARTPGIAQFLVLCFALQSRRAAGPEISPESVTNINGPVSEVANTAAVSGPPKQAPVSRFNRLARRSGVPDRTGV